MRCHTVSRDTPVAVHGRRNDSSASKSVRCNVHPPIFFSPPGHGLIARGYSSEVMTLPQSGRLDGGEQPQGLPD
jgi:hypothetical protein